MTTQTPEMQKLLRGLWATTYEKEPWFERMGGIAAILFLRRAYIHDPMVLEGDPERMDAHLPMIHITFSNLKTWLQGTHHSVSKQHLQAYLDEFVFRYNGRFYPMTGFASVPGIGIGVSALSYREFYDGGRDHHIHPAGS